MSDISTKIQGTRIQKSIERPKTIHGNAILKLLSSQFPLTPKQISEGTGLPIQSTRRSLRVLIDSGSLIRPRHGFYCLASQSVDSIPEESFRWQGTPYSSRKRETVKVAETLLKVLTHVVNLKHITIQDLVIELKIEKSVIVKAITRLRDAGILDLNLERSISIVPQEDPETIRTILMIASFSTWQEVIRSFILEYLKERLRKTQRNFQRLFRIRKYVRSRLPFLYPTEDREHFDDAINTLCIEGILVLEKAESDRYRFCLPGSMDTDSRVKSLAAQELISEHESVAP